MNVQYAKEVTELPAGSGGMAETLLMRLIRAGYYVDAPVSYTHLTLPTILRV